MAQTAYSGPVMLRIPRAPLAYTLKDAFQRHETSCKPIHPIWRPELRFSCHNTTRSTQTAGLYSRHVTSITRTICRARSIPSLLPPGDVYIVSLDFGPRGFIADRTVMKTGTRVLRPVACRNCMMQCRTTGFKCTQTMQSALISMMETRLSSDRSTAKFSCLSE